MIRGRDFVVLSDDWNGLPTSTMHLFHFISRHNRVFWFNLVNRMPQLNFADAKKALNFAKRWGKRPARAESSSGIGKKGKHENLHVITPFMIPCFKHPVRLLNRMTLLREYKRLAAEFNIENPFLFTVFPPAVDLVKSVTAAQKIYYCYDDFLEYPGFNAKDWRAMETDLLDGVNALVVSAQHLKQKNRRGCPTLHLPHGVDFDHFHGAVDALARVPRMETIRRPIVGFFGLISEWVNLKLIADLSKRHPQLSFVLLGKADVETQVLASCPNVHMLGFVPYQNLPAYARYFDVAMIPFVRSKLTEAVNPLKLMEYFALGLPVLATRLPELETIDGPLHLAETASDFSELLQRILSEKPGSSRSQALQVAQNSTWERRAGDLCTFIHQLEENATRDERAGRLCATAEGA